jgi:NADH:ubiquinone oxidoreductase subunit E
MAPVVMINDTVHQRVKPARVGDLLNRVLAADEKPATQERP